MVNIIGLIGILIASVGIFINVTIIKQILFLLELIVIIITIVLIVRKKYRSFIKAIFMIVLNVDFCVILFVSINGNVNMKKAQIVLIIIMLIFSVVEFINDHAKK